MLGRISKITRGLIRLWAESGGWVERGEVKLAGKGEEKGVAVTGWVDKANGKGEVERW